MYMHTNFIVVAYCRLQNSWNSV